MLLLLLYGKVSATVATAAGRVVGVGSWTASCVLDKVAVLDGRGRTVTALTACTVRAPVSGRVRDPLSRARIRLIPAGSDKLYA